MISFNIQRIIILKESNKSLISNVLILKLVHNQYKSSYKMSQLPVSAVSYGRPRNQLNNRNLTNALKANLIPAMVTDVHIVAVRCVFDFLTYGETVKQIAGRRRLLEKKLLECEEVIVCFMFSQSFLVLLKPMFEFLH